MRWTTLIANHAPAAMYGAPTKLTTSDSGLTYVFGSSETPVGRVEIRESPTGRLWIPGTEWDANSDFVIERHLIRFPNGKTKTFNDGPYARWVSPPGEISAATEPTMTPPFMRTLLVHQAVVYFATRGGNRNPEPFKVRLQELWSGDPMDPSDNGFLGMLKTQYAFQGAVTQSQGSRWYDSISTGDGYVVIR